MPNRSRRVVTLAMAAFSLTLLPAPTQAAGFAIFEQGAKSMGFGGAFVAQANDPSAIFHNAAGIAFLKGNQIHLGGTAIAPKTDFTGADPYPGAGITEKISISLSRQDLASLRKRAKRLHGGNVSAVIAELAADAALLEGMHELATWLGGPSLTDQERTAIDREWAPRAGTRTTRKKKKAA
jgi:hypothetical protein